MTIETLTRYTLDLQTFLHGVNDIAAQPQRGIPFEDIVVIRTRHVRALQAQRTFTVEEQALLDRYIADDLTWAEMLTVKRWIFGH